MHIADRVRKHEATRSTGIARPSDVSGPADPGLSDLVPESGRRDHLISSAETVSPPLRVMILFKTILLMSWVTGRTLPSQKAKFTMLGCLLIQ